MYIYIYIYIYIAKQIQPERRAGVAIIGMIHYATFISIIFFYYRALCCEDTDPFSNDCWNCYSEMSDYYYEMCGLQCVPENTHPQDDPMFCPCKDEFWGECCKLGNVTF